MTVRTEPTEQSAVVANELAATVASFRRHVRRTAGAPFPGVPLSGAQIELVRLIRERPDVSVAEAAAELALAPNTVSTLVKQLTEQHILTRSTDAHDRRVVRLNLTPSARTRLQRWRGHRNALVAAAIAELDPHDREVLQAALPVIHRIANALAHTEGDR